VLSRFFKILTLIGFLVVFGIGYANYLIVGEFTFDIYRIDRYIGLNRNYLYTSLIILVGVIFFQFFYYKKVFHSRQNCQVQYVELEKIATNWLEKEEIIENIKNSYTPVEVIDHSSKAKEEFIASLFLQGSFIQTKPYIQKYVINKLKYYKNEEIVMVFRLFDIIEQGGNVPSVASSFSDDYDNKAFNKSITVDGKTSYQVLSEITLKEHTLNVLEFSVEKLIREYSDEYLIAKVVIIALAHDIGKISNILGLKNSNKTIDEKIYNSNPHEKVSKIMMMSLFPEYSDMDMILDAIISHHGKPSSTLAKILFESDREAREFETKQWFMKSKNGETEKSDSVSKDTEQNTKKASSAIENEDNFYALISNPDIKNSFLATLSSSVNRVEELPASGKVNLISISEGQYIYFTKRFIGKTLTNIGIKTRTEGQIESVLDFFRNDGVLDGKKIEMTIEGMTDFPRPKKETFYRIVGKSLGFSENDLVELKRDNPYLRNAHIQKNGTVNG